MDCAYRAGDIEKPFPVHLEAIMPAVPFDYGTEVAIRLPPVIEGILLEYGTRSLLYAWRAEVVHIGSSHPDYVIPAIGLLPFI